jgi:CheY-like chemotaxis protein
MAFGFSWEDGIDALDAGDDAELAAEIDVAQRVRGRYPAGARLNFGAPTRCPRCGEFGLVDEVDLTGGRSRNHCHGCDHVWAITVRALLALDGRGSRPTRGPRAWLAELTRRRSAAGGLAPAPDLAGIRFTRSDDGEVHREVVAEATAPLPPPPVSGAGDGPDHWVAPVLPLRVLLVEDDPGHVQTIRSLVGPSGPSAVDLRTATTRTAGEVAARVSEPDLVLLDLGLPDSRGAATLAAWQRRHAGGPPVIVVHDEPVDPGVELGPGVAGVVDRAELRELLDRGEQGRTAFLDLLGGSAAPPGTPWAAR